jgi:hypothetical protein
VGDRQGEEIKRCIEHLVASRLSGLPLDTVTARWVADVADPIAGKLAAGGLIPRRVSLTLGQLLDTFIGQRAKAKPNTLMNLNQAWSSTSAPTGTCAASHPATPTRGC